MADDANNSSDEFNYISNTNMYIYYLLVHAHLSMVTFVGGSYALVSNLLGPLK